jgi:hypothetical protein
VLPWWSLNGNLEEALTRLESLWDIPEHQTDKYYNLERARSLVTTYAACYAEDKTGLDRFQIARLGDKPLIEVEARLPVYVSPELEIVYMGYLDRLVIDPIDQSLWVLDVKTTGQSTDLNRPWAISQRNSEQFVGYAWMANQLYAPLGLEVKGTIIDAIYTKNIAITPANMVRFKVPRDVAKERAFLHRTEWIVKNLVVPIMTDTLQAFGNAPTSCGTYGGCDFLRVCDGSQENYRPQIAETLFEKRVDR